MIPALLVPRSCVQCVHFVTHEQKYTRESSFSISSLYDLRRSTLRSRAEHTLLKGSLTVQA